MANSKLKKITINGTTYEVSVWFGSCGTSSTTQIKVVTIPGFTSDSLVDGTQVVIYFSNPHTSDRVPHLDINSTGSKAICYNGSTFAGQNAWKAREVVTFTYYSSTWYMDRRDYLTIADLPVYDGTVT